MSATVAAEVMRYISGRPETGEEIRVSIDRVKARWAEWRTLEAQRATAG